LIAILSATLVLQITQLAGDLPKCEANLRAKKVRALGGAPLTSRVLDWASDTLRDLQEEITKQTPAASGQKPLPVEVRQPEPSGLDAIAGW
jgi:hypothetical protein